ncbi:uncharacterized protein LOC132726182 [Ruditapes philippinarum]|uniref:uncharacterized protein LOC132726182 n=1 Tax=Ruditapes philippinarum TaxID=129788 RepID=UPI00295B75BC|nr:uncharacterized protein LOC132726182 [Ruditapes philippinarum]
MKTKSGNKFRYEVEKDVLYGIFETMKGDLKSETRQIVVPSIYHKRVMSLAHESIVVDYATRYPEAVALPRIEIENIADALLDIFARVGFPSEILNDRGSQFTTQLMEEVCRLVSLKQLFTTPYNPKCSGLCERMNGILKRMLKKMCQERPKDYDRYLSAVLFAYREVPQSSTGFSPFELLYGRILEVPCKH